ncbi:MAG: carboxymuconolactone decarboxylase family protein [Methylophilaceae bacterium]|nr:carboxymuconolactone decarboxylase family protein [Methyloradius sp.]
MARINVVTTQTANDEQKSLFTAIEAQLGGVPNFLRGLANSPTALKAFLGLYGITHGGSLDNQTAERLAIALAQQNECEYCLSAHSAFGKKAGLSKEEISENRLGNSEDIRAGVAVKFAKELVANMGDITTADIQGMHAAGYSDSDIVEVITHVAMNVFTNILAKSTQIDIDFPRVSLS